MGRASRRKRLSNEVVPTPCERRVLDSLPTTIYKFFPAAEYADASCAGAVWVSTLAGWRAAEEPGRRDDGEATLHYNSGTLIGSSGEPVFEHVIEQIGIQAENCRDMTISNVSRTTAILDAYGISTTEKHSPDDMGVFGPYCVEITTPMAFFDAVTKSLLNARRIVVASIGRVNYAPRSYTGRQAAPGILGFVKPQTYSTQAEIRMLWQPAIPQERLQPFALTCDAVRGFCKRLA